MTTIARIIVTDADLRNKRKLFTDFVTESQKILSKGEKHQFVLLPAGFLTFSVKNDLTNIPLVETEEKSGKQQWNATIELLKEEALSEFYRNLDSETLTKLKSVAKYLVIGIDNKVTNKEDKRIQFVLVYDLQSGKAMHWTGKTYPQSGERKYLIRMPVHTHFIRTKIDGKKVAVFACHDLSIFNPRHQHLFSPFDNERKGESRKENTPAGKIKCPFIDATLDFAPEIMLQLAHTEGTWAAKWTKLNGWLQKKNKGKGLKHFASGLKKNPKDGKQYTLSGTQRGDVVNFVNGKWTD
jgi:hypothetical protein